MEPITQSSSATPPPPKPKPRRFRCCYEGCGRGFTRAEHLQRHGLNHQPSPNTCERCCAHFARPDLLGKGSPMIYIYFPREGREDVGFEFRHMDRHAQKDKLAGGEGLGVLGTRKRCWRDHNGNITTRRPAASLDSSRKPSTSPKSQKGRGRGEGGSSGNGAGNMRGGGACVAATAPMPQSCTTASSARPQRSDGGHSHNISPQVVATTTAAGVGAFGRFQSRPLGLAEPGTFGGENFQLSLPPPPQTYQLNPLLSGVPPPTAEALTANYQPELDQSLCVGPDFSLMPFTTLMDDALLFGGSDSHPGTGAQPGTGFDLSQALSDMGMGLEPFATSPGNSEQLMPTPTDDSLFPPFDVKASTNRLETVSQRYPDFQGLGELDKTPPVEDHSCYFLPDAQSISHDTPSRDSHIATTTTNITRHSLNPEPVHALPIPHTQPIPVSSSPTSNCNPFHEYKPTSASTSKSSSPILSSQPLPKIDEEARKKALSLIVQATTNANGGPQFSWDDPLLSLPALQSYLDLFFCRVNQLYPLFHGPTFDPSNVNALLLVSVLMLGATYGEKDAHQMAVRVYNVLRGVLVSVGLVAPEA
ncbi:unnamed protein product [Tuber aestivum]|uniref:C2H2-type domain-containing protein n=1 Tax=Tuber aestivum TaxID=59557 RepID=A0A292PQ51_9PEZI|nr:unnamed protein product [Tuber aestivum]